LLLETRKAKRNLLYVGLALHFTVFEALYFTVFDSATLSDCLYILRQLAKGKALEILRKSKVR